VADLNAGPALLALALIAVSLFAGIVLWLRAGRREKAPPVVRTARPPRRRPRHFYGSVFQPGTQACRFARALSEQRFLMGEEPRIPVPGCDQGNCACRLIPTDDRRSKRDRRLRFSAWGDDFDPGSESNEPRPPRGRDRRGS
jgi:hypothetical protein